MTDTIEYIMNNDSKEYDLTEQENNELKQHPIGSIKDRLTVEQFKLRQTIAEKLGKKIYQIMLPDKTEAVADIFRAFPIWKFYTTRDCPMIKRRCFGVMEMEENQYRLHMASALTIMPVLNDVIGGVTCEETVVLDDWTEEQYDVLDSPLMNDRVKSVMLDPLGYIMLLGDRR